MSNSKKIIFLIIFFFGLFGLAKNSQAALEGPGSGLAGWWRFDEGSGGYAYDSSGNANTATLMGSPTWVSGQRGGGLLFNGVTDYLRIREGDSLRLGPKTIVVWANLFDFLKRYAGVYSFAGPGCTDSYYGMAHYSSSFGTYYENSSDAIIRSIYPAGIGTWKLGEWAHYAIVFNGVDSPGGSVSISVYKNGVLQSPGYTSSDGLSADCTLRAIGSQEDYPNPDYIRTFSGIMDEYRVYNRVLSVAEIAELYSTQRIVSSDASAPSTPTSLNATAISASKINLSWNPSSDNVGVVGYIIYRGGSPIATVRGGTTYTDTSHSPSATYWYTLAPSTSYAYTVAAYDAAYNVSPVSSSASATTLAAITSGPFSINVTINGTGSSNLSSNVISYPSGISCTSGTCSSSFAGGSYIQILPHPYISGWRAGYDLIDNFTGWSGAGCSGNGGCVILMDSNKSVIATYGAAAPPATYSLSVSKSGTGAGTVSGGSISCGSVCSQSGISSGTSITLTASASSGSTFSGWSGGGCSGTGTCTIAITGNTTVAATFNATATPVNGSCGTTLNSCTAGTFSDITDTSSNYLWSCVGSGGGTTASCSLPIGNNPPGGLVGWWRFDEGTGTTVSDSSGRGHTGTFVNNPTWVTGRIGGALSFDGVDDYVRIPASGDFDAFSEFSVSAWVYSKELSTARKSAVGRAMGNLWHLWSLEQISTARFDEEYVVRAVYGESSYRGIGNGIGYSTDAWHHVVGVKTAGNIVKIYIDGVPGTDSAIITQPAPTDLAGVDIAIGSRRAITPDNTWNGYIDEVRFYNKALSSAEVTALYNTSSNDTTPPAAPSGVTIQ